MKHIHVFVNHWNKANRDQQDINQDEGKPSTKYNGKETFFFVFPLICQNKYLTLSKNNSAGTLSKKKK